MIPRMGRRGLFRLWLSAMLFVGAAAGCLHRQLEFTARRTLNTLPDLQYQQVMDNLAAVASNPARLPYLAVAGQGAIQVTDNGTTTLGLSIPINSSTSDGLGFGASRNVTGTWSLGTITSPDKIRAMQALYQRAVAGSAQRDLAYVWLNVGGKRDVPADSSYAGRYGNVSVWVMGDGIAGLSDLTLAILDIATREDTAPPASPPGHGWQRGTVPRRNFQLPATGPVFTPGAG
jgi:hypothetical protein